MVGFFLGRSGSPFPVCASGLQILILTFVACLQEGQHLAING